MESRQRLGSGDVTGKFIPKFHDSIYMDKKPSIQLCPHHTGALLKCLPCKYWITEITKEINKIQYLNIWILPFPLVKKNRSPSLFQLISLTSNLNCSSTRALKVLASINVTKSSLFPTAMVWPSGDQHTLIFSPERTFNTNCNSHV